MIVNVTFSITGERNLVRQIPTYLVIGIKGVTRLDLTETIAAAIPDARIVSARTIPEAAAAAREIVNLAGAIVRSGVQELHDSELAGILQAAQARIVLIGETAEDQATQSPYPVLQRPFGIDDVLTALNLQR